MAGKELIEISQEYYLSLQDKRVSEEIAHSLLQTQQRVLMIFWRNDGSMYGYEASEVTDLNHAKKVQLVEFEWFYRTKL